MNLQDTLIGMFTFPIKQQLATPIMHIKWGEDLILFQQQGWIQFAKNEF